MKQIPAMRKHDGTAYGTTDRWYYNWPALKCAFRTDYPGLKFNPDEGTEELTIEEYAAISVRYNKERNHVTKHNGGRRYFYTEPCKVFATEGPVVPIHAVELTYEEYITLSIQFDQNPDDTLL